PGRGARRHGAARAAGPGPQERAGPLRKGRRRRGHPRRRRSGGGAPRAARLARSGPALARGAPSRHAAVLVPHPQRVRARLRGNPRPHPRVPPRDPRGRRGGRGSGPPLSAEPPVLSPFHPRQAEETMNFRHVKPVFAAILAIAAFLTASCDLGEPIRTSGPTEVEGLTGTLVTPSGAPAAGAWVKAYAAPANA